MFNKLTQRLPENCQILQGLISLQLKFIPPLLWQTLGTKVSHWKGFLPRREKNGMKINELRSHSLEAFGKRNRKNHFPFDLFYKEKYRLEG
jgi:hypothetical protein